MSDYFAIVRRVVHLTCATLAVASLSTLAEEADVMSDSPNADAGYQNFNAAIYSRVYEVQKMADPAWLEHRWNLIERDIKVDKIYLETHRDMILASDETLNRLKDFYADRGVETAGGITLTIDESNRFETFCYSNKEHRAWVRKVIEHTAKHFDEIILDDFYFTSCKSKGEIKAKGRDTWPEYRMELLAEAAEDLVLKPARKVNPNVKVIIKYPNWYDDFHGLGFSLEEGPAQFDGVYTGTETRDAVRSAQHLQPYHSYQIFRYFENITPGNNGGGWVDTGGMRNLDRYAEQLWLTLFAKAPEVTLFDFRQMYREVKPEYKGYWQNGSNSLDFDAVIEGFVNDDGVFADDLRMSRVAGWSLEKIDPLIGMLGNPYGIASYKPYHSTGEDFLHNFIGMAGLPIDLYPSFPEEAPIVLLTQAAAHDEDIVEKIQDHLMRGNNVVITSGLLNALEGRGIKHIAELEVTERKAIVHQFMAGRGELVESRKDILIPQINYFTNDSWELVSAVDGAMGWPILHDADYAGQHLYVLTIPDNFSDFYQLPENALKGIRQVLMSEFPVRVDAPGGVSVFVYDNKHLVVQSFLNEPVTVTLVANKGISAVMDALNGEQLSGTQNPPNPEHGWSRGPDAEKWEYPVELQAHSYRVFRW